MTTSIRINPDKDHLKLLAIFHYILAGLTACAGCIPLIHVSIGIAMVTGAFDNGRGPPPPPMIGVIFIAVGGSFSLGLWTVAVLTLIAGRCLARHTGYRYCFVVAVLECLQMPTGTILGVFTILVLSRNSVKMLFQGIEPREPKFGADEGDEPEAPPAPRAKSDDGSVREGGRAGGTV